MKLLKNKSIKKMLVIILGLSIISTTGFAIYNFGIKNISSSNVQESNSNDETVVPNEIPQPTFTSEQENEIVKDGYFLLDRFNEIFKNLIPNEIEKYEILTNDISKPDKIKIHYWTSETNNYWFYSFYK